MSKMEIILIAAISKHYVLGFNGKIPWKVPEDMDRFRKLTLEHPVIMGRKTYESLPEKSRPLPGRKNIVLSKTLEPRNGIHIARSLDEALESTEGRDSYVMGGREIYKLFLPKATRLEITQIDGDFPGDVFFPVRNLNDEWRLSMSMSTTSRNQGIPYSFLTYERR